MQYLKRDNNEQQITNYLSKIGIYYEKTKEFDLVVAYKDEIIIFEIKNPNTTWRYTQSQKIYSSKFTNYFTIKSVSDVTEVLSILNIGDYEKRKEIIREYKTKNKIKINS